MTFLWLLEGLTRPSRASAPCSRLGNTWPKPLVIVTQNGRCCASISSRFCIINRGKQVWLQQTPMRSKVQPLFLDQHLIPPILGEEDCGPRTREWILTMAPWAHQSLLQSFLFADENKRHELTADARQSFPGFNTNNYFLSPFTGLMLQHSSCVPMVLKTVRSMIENPSWYGNSSKVQQLSFINH